MLSPVLPIFLMMLVLRKHDADIIGLQECDAARVATGTFGIALLSKYPNDIMK